MRGSSDDIDIKVSEKLHAFSPDQAKVNFGVGSTIPRPEEYDAASRTVLDGDA